MTMTVGTQEIWRCAYVGRFKVDRLLLKDAHGAVDPTKPAQQRLSIRHIPDPYSKGNTRGGPAIIVHKHSRANAFSVFRAYDLIRSSAGGRGVHMNTSTSILLAPRKVQQQYTSTRTTSKLNSHGLLADRPPAEGAQTASAGSGGGVGRTSTSSSASGHGYGFEGRRKSTSRQRKEREERERKEREKRERKERKEREKKEKKEREREKREKEKEKEKLSTGESEGGWKFARRYSMKKAATPPPATTTPPPPPPPPPVAMTPQPPPAQLPPLPSSSSSTTAYSPPAISVSSAPSSSKSSSMEYSQPSVASSQQSFQQSTYAGSLRERDEIDLDDDDDDLEGRHYHKTSHAEAFTALDSSTIEYMRTRTESSSRHEDGTSIGQRLKRAIIGPSGSRSSGRVQAPPPPASAALEGKYDPPWMTMAPRTKVEEHERVLHHLNESFKDVGLLPSKPPKSRTPRDAAAPRRGSRTDADVFEGIPDDSLYMLLPLWPGETDAQAPAEPPVHVPVDERLYLLVYYTMFEDKPGEDGKKRARMPPPAGGGGGGGGEHVRSRSRSSMSQNISAGRAFRASARIVSYDDVRSSGIRLPAEGLAVTGALSEARANAPPRPAEKERIAEVIAYCTRRDQGVFLVPEGLLKLGLCLPLDTVDQTPPPVEGFQEPEYPHAGVINIPPLNPIGRAAVEMAWLGCMALSSFGGA
ncbi:hypothetical protein PUNSTDRAFT_50429 [Punctularia strigosozonata HHB-11173 SS5]|uniref:uncharacterized protein n=1 Tax=Punctularia strigosozonata (strain HHB-11173) TaxID=741275 RepID=UPI0004416CC2|nr:uncharacterized protein PUNSTDRAFT_50429 [Punctularia strigosozonata HHB-11173 SS5]EIN11433.1 hypothetical protein PUNSTDRAFT_50429 [Punctularia strigosozonata HHB-11173 SS5]